MQNLIGRAAHVFYYEFLDGYDAQPQRACEARAGEPDTALYVPGGDASAPDRPRPAAAWIFDDGGGPSPYAWSAFTGPGSAQGALTLTDGSGGSALSVYGGLGP